MVNIEYHSHIDIMPLGLATSAHGTSNAVRYYYSDAGKEMSNLIRRISGHQHSLSPFNFGSRPSFLCVFARRKYLAGKNYFAIMADMARPFDGLYL